MFGLFRSAAIVDPVLRDLRRARGRWRGKLTLAGTVIPISLAGSRVAPNDAALSEARSLPSKFETFRPAIEAALFEHDEPYADAVSTGELPKFSGAPIESPNDVWANVSLEFVSIEPMDGVLTTEIAYGTQWDDEHLLGARFQSGTLVELCGSTVPS